MITRRTFLKYTGGTVLTLFMFNKFGIRQAIAAIEGGTLDPGDVDKFQTPLLIPPVMPKAEKIRQTGGQNVDYYEISMKQFDQQILPAGYPATTVWGYGAVASASKSGLLLHNAPSLTIEATSKPPGADQMDQRLARRHWQLPAAPAAGRSDPALGQSARRHSRPRHSDQVLSARPMSRPPALRTRSAQPIYRYTGPSPW